MASGREVQTGQCAATLTLKNSSFTTVVTPACDMGLKSTAYAVFPHGSLISAALEDLRSSLLALSYRRLAMSRIFGFAEFRGIMSRYIPLPGSNRWKGRSRNVGR